MRSGFFDDPFQSRASSSAASDWRRRGIRTRARGRSAYSRSPAWADVNVVPAAGFERGVDGLSASLQVYVSSPGSSTARPASEPYSGALSWQGTKLRFNGLPTRGTLLLKIGGHVCACNPSTATALGELTIEIRRGMTTTVTVRPVPCPEISTSPHPTDPGLLVMRLQGGSQSQFTFNTLSDHPALVAREIVRGKLALPIHEAELTTRIQQAVARQTSNFAVRVLRRSTDVLSCELTVAGQPKATFDWDLRTVNAQQMAWEIIRARVLSRRQQRELATKLTRLASSAVDSAQSASQGTTANAARPVSRTTTSLSSASDSTECADSGAGQEEGGATHASVSGQESSVSAPAAPAMAPPASLQRRYSTLSTARLDTLAQIEKRLAAVESRVGGFTEAVEAGQASSAQLGVIKDALAQSFGALEKLQYHEIDAVHTGDLTSGHDDARTLRKSLTRRTQSAMQRVEKLVERIRVQRQAVSATADGAAAQ